MPAALCLETAAISSEAFEESVNHEVKSGLQLTDETEKSFRDISVKTNQIASGSPPWTQAALQLKPRCPECRPRFVWRRPRYPLKRVNHEVKSGLQLTDETEKSFRDISVKTNQIASELQNPWTQAALQLKPRCPECRPRFVWRRPRYPLKRLILTLEKMAEELRELTKRFKITLN
jgi:hypothetical protein